MDFLISLLSKEPEKVFAYFLLILFIIVGTLVLLSFYNDYTSKKRFEKRVEAFERTLKDLVEEFRSFELMFSEQKRQSDDYKFILNNIEQEISRLADSLSGDKNITMAISLAKEGLQVSEISEKTGIPIEEIEPIVKFHGTTKN